MHLVHFRHVLQGTRFVTSGLLSSFFKGVRSKGKESEQLHPFRGDPFSEGKQNNFDRVTSPESVSILFNKDRNVRKRTFGHMRPT